MQDTAVITISTRGYADKMVTGNLLGKRCKSNGGWGVVMVLVAAGYGIKRSSSHSSVLLTFQMPFHSKYIEDFCFLFLSLIE